MMFEPLESKLFFAASPFSLSNKVLTISGTSRADHIEIAAGASVFTAYVNGQQASFKNAAVKNIRILGGSGNDTLIASPHLAIRTSIEGGAGNDRIGGGSGNDTIVAGSGNDTIAGNAGDDYIDAGADDDRIEDIAGVNVVHGGSGNDFAATDERRLGTGVERGATSAMALVRRGGSVILQYTLDESVSSLSSVISNGDRPAELKEADFDRAGPVADSQLEERNVTAALRPGLLFTVTRESRLVFTVPLLIPGRYA